MRRLRAWWLALGLLVPAAAAAEQQAAQQEVEVANGEVIPDLRACVDYVGRGSFHSLGKPELLEDPDDLIGHALYSYRFGERVEVVGHSAWQSKTLVRSGHALMDVHAADMVVFLGRKDRLLDTAPVWKDRAGRAFLPIFAWPQTERGGGWEPLAIRRFARPVTYAARLGRRRDPEGVYDDEDPDLYALRHGRWFVRYGLYLSDIPALLAAAKDEPCWR